MTNNSTSFVGQHVIDDQHESVGKVTDVLYDQGSDHVEWLVVKPGLLGGERYVPAEGAYQTADGEVVVPFDKRWVKRGPRAGSDHTLTSRERADVAAHYDVAVG